MFDVKPGDILMLNGQEYPVRAVECWRCNRAASASFARMASEEAATKRNPAPVAGKIGEPEIKLVGIRCLPLDPVDAELQRRLALNAPYTLLQTMIADTDSFTTLVVEALR